MTKSNNHPCPWLVIGAGPAGIASVGLLLEAGVCDEDIVWVDPNFNVGDIGQYWGEVYSNTKVQLFLQFLNEIEGFAFHTRPTGFPIESLPEDGFCQLREVGEALVWVSNQLRQRVHTVRAYVKKLQVDNGAWQVDMGEIIYQADKVILAVGAEPKSLTYEHPEQISLYAALNPDKLKDHIRPNDCFAVFGSSHSSMIIMKNLLDLGVKNIINFYLSPHRYALQMNGWILYDNTGLKGSTAEWTRENISKQLDPRIRRYLSNANNIKQYMPACHKAIYPVGFKTRALDVVNVDTERYDVNTGIIAPGLFGAGIAYPRLKVDPLGGSAFNVGLYKFMHDIRDVLPIWQQYGL